MTLQKERNNRCPQIICWALVLLWMCVIFWFSAQVADESKAMSGGVMEFLLRLLGIDSTAPENAELVDTMTFWIRKTAHFTEYTILGLLTCTAWRTQGISRPAWFGWGLGTLYAVSDEIHQLFVEGRSCEVRDMAIDSSGVLLGVCLATGIVWITRRIHK